MKNQRLFIISLLALAAIAFGVRTLKLSSLPPGLTWDEAALGYNAYSILKTGRDEHGALFPLVFKSFGDYKPGLYIYLTVPFVALLGLTETAVRLPSALFGSLTVIVLALFVRQLSKSSLAGFFSALALAFMPWHLHFSRSAWEVNVFVFFLTTGLYLLIRNLRQNRSLLAPVLCFLVSLYLYQAAKILVPVSVTLTVLTLFPISRDWIKKIVSREKTYLPVYLIIFFVIAYFIYQTSIGPAGNRLARLNLFNYRPAPVAPAVFNTLPDSWLRMVASRYLYHFSGELLFSGSAQTLRETLPKMGMLHLLDGILLFAGLIKLVRLKEKRTTIFILGLLFAAPLGGSLTLAEYSTVRSLFMVIPLAIILGLGLWHLNGLPKFIPLAFILIYLHTLILDIDLYFNHNGKLLGEGFNEGQKRAVQLINDLKPQRVIYTDVYGQPYIYYLFYSAYDPAQYQQKNRFVDGGVDVGFVPSLDNIEFHQFSIDDINTNKNTLFIGTIGNITDNFNPSAENIAYYEQINYSSGHPAMRVVKTAP